jgi:hypothetical protein
MTIQNGERSMHSLFGDCVLRIPVYQRTYAWGQQNWSVFLDDLRAQPEDRPFFLGTILLQSPTFRSDRSDPFEEQLIVDGQQRLTTAVILIAALIRGMSSDSKESLTLARRYLFDDGEEVSKFHTVSEDDDHLQSFLLKPHVSSFAKGRSRSQCRLSDAFEFFSKELNEADRKTLPKKLNGAKVMVYSVDNPADAAQIFEFQNDRGKRLTDLEAMKGFLMYNIYLYAKKPDDYLRRIDERFKKIFRVCDEFEELGLTKDVPEDSILQYHCVAHLPWRDDKHYSRPKEFAKQLIEEYRASEQSPVDWILTFTDELLDTFQNVRDLLKSRDNIVAFAQLFVLGRLYQFWPLLIKTYKERTESSSDFERLVQLMEIWSFTGYGIANKRSNKNEDRLRVLARDFNGDFPKLIEDVRRFSKEVKDEFRVGLERARFADEKSDAKYLLWRYENYLRSQTGRKTSLLTWEQYLEETDTARKFNIEHILSQNDEKRKEKVRWAAGDEEKEFDEVCMNRLGNLVIDSWSPNSSRQDKPFLEKLPTYDRSQFYSQKEINDFSSELNDERNWDVNAVRRRQERLVNFALKEWDPDVV